MSKVILFLSILMVSSIHYLNAQGVSLSDDEVMQYEDLMYKPITKTIQGYTVTCYSDADIWLEMKSAKTHKYYDFCNKDAVTLILNTAKNMPINFGGDLKLISFKPYLNNRPQNQYTIPVVVDDVGKKIIPNNDLYATGNFFNYILGNEKLNQKIEISKIYSHKNTFMYCFNNKDFAYIGNGSLYLKSDVSQKYLCGAYWGIENPNEPSKDIFQTIAFQDNEYNLFGGLTTEKANPFNTPNTHRTAKQLIKQ